ncbi:PH domain-containing protein [Faecalicatena contorta]|uniref:PH domain-containing protein n=1 Tax=Faecalicatena contorta TaxID=39482 RepID=UPI001F1FEA50|nr:PH domain-containing protein [Faecalicatena contorta]MCF2555580.1 PH domain-containing protein [Faecalicatena contorta]
MAFGMKDVLSSAKSVAGSNLVQGVLNNYSEMSAEEMQQEYGMYLIDGEEITVGFKLIRDALIFTNKRIIFTDKQGATGIKMRVESINLFSVVDVTMETAGFGFDDSELTFTYIKTPNLKAHHVEYVSHKLEFPKKYNVQPLYKLLQELAYSNCLKINGLE